MPDPNGLTALTIWILATITFVFVALLLYGFILIRIKKAGKKPKPSKTSAATQELDLDPMFLVIHCAAFGGFVALYVLIHVAI